MDITIATQDDLEGILNCFEESILGICTNDYTSEELSTWLSGKNNTTRWLKAIEEQYFLVAKELDSIAGFASLKDNIIDFMYISPNHQKKGLAQSLFNSIESKAKVNQIRTLYTYASKTAKPFFSKIGFDVIRENIVDISGIKLKNYFMEKRIYTALPHT